MSVNVMDSTMHVPGGEVNVVTLSDGEVFLDLGVDLPRVWGFGFCGRTSVFATLKGAAEPEKEGYGDNVWNPRGAARAWIAPECQMTYANYPGRYEVETGEDFAVLHVPGNVQTGWKHSIKATLYPGKRKATVEVTWTNISQGVMEIYPWSPTMMAPGGLVIAKLPYDHIAHEDGEVSWAPPENPVIPWSFTDFHDPRLTIGEKAVILRNNPDTTHPNNKVGLPLEDPRIGYLASDGTLFVKKAVFDPDGQYADRGATVEMFTCPDMVEAELLFPRSLVSSGKSVTVKEEWSLARVETRPTASADELTETVLPRVLDM